MMGLPLETILESSTLRIESLPMGVKRIVLCRPEVRNAFDEAMIIDLSNALDTLSKIEEMRLLLLEGEGQVFSAGADLSYMKRLGLKSEEESFRDARSLAGLFYRLADFPVPVLAIVQGAAIGGGLGLTVCADYVLAEEDAVFATSEVRLGIVPGIICPYIVRKIGLAAAAPIVLTGRRLNACEAATLGLVQKVTSDAQREDALQGTIAEFLSGEPNAVRRTKALLKKTFPLPDSELIDYSARQLAEARCSEDAQKGLNAFLSKNVPAWMETLSVVYKRKP